MELIVLLSYRSNAFKKRFGSIIQLTCLCRVVWRSFFGGRTE